MKKLEFEDMQPLIKHPYKLTMAGTSHTRQQDRIILRCLQVLQPLIVSTNKKLLIKSNEALIIPKKTPAIGTFEEIKNDKGTLESIKLRLVAKSLILKNSDSRKHLRESLKGLESNTVHFWKRDENGQIVEEGFVNLFTKAKINHKSKVADIKIDVDALPYLLKYSQYTRLHAENAFKISSQNTVEIYKIISHFRDKKQTHIIPIEELKKSMMLDGKYKQPRHIKQRILEPAIKTLSATDKNGEHMYDIWFDIAERVMNGRKFVGWRFNIYTKEPKKPKPKKLALEQLSDTQLEEKSKANKEEAKKLEEQKAKRWALKIEEANIKELINSFKLSEWQAKKVIDYQSASYENRQIVSRQLNRIKKRKDIENIGAYTVQVFNKQLNIDL